MDIDLGLLRTVEREKEIPFEELVRIIEQAILTAYAKHTSPTGELPEGARVELDRKTGHVAVFIPLLDEEGAVIGEEESTPEDFGRIAAFAAKQVISQRLRDIADDAVLGEFKGKEGDIVAGVVQQGPNPRMVHVDLGTVEAILPPEEQVAGEQYTHGSRLRVYVTSVAEGHQGSADHGVAHAPRVSSASSSRSRCPRSPSGLVEIVSLAREAGHRTKIAVKANDPTINAKGACIGELGRRVRAVTEELSGEKIDIVDYDPELAKFVANALSPAKVTSSFILDASSKAVRALVPDYQLSLAIGKEGQNARLAAKLTGAKIDIQPDSILEERLTAGGRSERGAGGRAKPGGVTWNLYERVSDAARVLPGPPFSGWSPSIPSSSSTSVRSMPGRGAWVHETQECVDAAIRRRAFVRALRVSGPLDTQTIDETAEWLWNQSERLEMSPVRN